MKDYPIVKHNIEVDLNIHTQTGYNFEESNNLIELLTAYLLRTHVKVQQSQGFQIIFYYSLGIMTVRAI